jgi:non-ribosomal peptide synthetase component F
VLLTVLNILLWKYTFQCDISIGCPIANRTNLETEGLIGFFANTLVFRNEVSGDVSFRDMLARVRDTALGAYAHQYMPFEKLVEDLKPQRAGYNPLFQVNFRVLTSPPAPLRLGTVTAERLHYDPGVARFDLALELLITPDRFEGFFEYSTDLFYPETIHKLQDDFPETLRLLAGQPSVVLSEIGLKGESGWVGNQGRSVIRRRQTNRARNVPEAR